MIFVVVAFIIFLLCCISSFLLFDEILRIQYKNHNSEWISDGRPHGFFFKPEETKSPRGGARFGSWLAMQRRCFVLNWKTPRWALDEPEVLKLLFRYRLSGILAVLAWFCFGYAAMRAGR